MKTTLSLLTVLFLSNLALAQTTAIPDPNFEQELINLGYDTGVPDGVVLTTNIDTVTSLDIGSKNISDLTGIQDFTSLYTLRCYFNQLTSLNVSQNTLLNNLYCGDNQLTSLIINGTTSLSDLRCGNNLLSNLDVSQNTALINIYCPTNQLTSLDVTQNVNLFAFDCWNNQLTSLDLSQNIGLKYFNCSTNQLTSLDMTQNIGLISLNFRDNQLSSIDATQNTVLTTLICSSNLLSCLNVKNGNNTNFTIFEAWSNPNLTCIEVDDVAWATTNWTQIDAGASFSTNCPTSCSVGINENNLSEISLYPNPTLGNITIDLGEIKTDVGATLTNSLGKAVFTQQFESTDIINIEINAPSGIYFLQLKTSKGETKTIKILKE